MNNPSDYGYASGPHYPYPERLADDVPVAHADSWPSLLPPSIKYPTLASPATTEAYARLEAQALITAKALLAAKAVIETSGYPIRGSQELDFAIQKLKAAIERSEGITP